MAMDVLVPLGQGFQYGAVVTNSKRLEDSVRAGANGFMTMACQSSQVAFTLLQADRAMEAAGAGYVPLPVRILLVITPGLLTWITYMGVENDTARDIVVFLQDQIGNLCQVAGVVSSVALIFFGQVILGGVSVGFLGLGFLDRNGLLPECVRHVLHDYTPTAAMAAGILVGGVFEKIFGVANLAIFCYSQFQSYQSNKQIAAIDAQTTPEMRAAAQAQMNAVTQKDARLSATEQVAAEQDPALLQGPLTVAKLQAHLAAGSAALGWFTSSLGLTSGRYSLRDVDADHIYYRTRPKAPNVDYRELKTMFDKIDWAYKATPASSCAIDVVRRKCAADQRFMKRNGNPLKKTEEAAAAIDTIRKACADSEQFTRRHKDPLEKNKEGTAFLISDEKIIQYASEFTGDSRLKGMLIHPLQKLDGKKIYVMSDEYLMKYAKESFDACIDQIYSHYIPDGEPRSYDELEDNLKVITHALQQKAQPGEVSIKDNERIDTLLTLAVDGGRYCGPGKYEVIERVYAGLVCEGGICSTRKKVLNILQDKRGEMVMAMYAEIPNLFIELPKILNKKLNRPDLEWCEWMNVQWARATMYIYNLTIDWHDKHVYNQFLNMYAPDLGTRKGGADNDATAAVDPTMKLALQWIANMFKADFMGQYSASAILETITEKMDTKSLPKQALTDWWLDWVYRQQDLLSDAEKEGRTPEQQKELITGKKTEMAQEIADNSTLFGKVIFDENGALTEPFMVAMLFDMGVYGEPAPVAADAAAPDEDLYG